MLMKRRTLVICPSDDIYGTVAESKHRATDIKRTVDI
jgi:hypothetical protein